MDWLVDFFNSIKTEHIALASIIITVIIFVLNRRSELKYKKHEDKKAQYIKVIELLSLIYEGFPKDKKTGQVIINRDMKKQFYDVGSSLLLYGSKKLYKQYIFFREFSNNPLFQISKYYTNEIILFLIAQLLVTIRKEVGISKFNQISLSDSLAFIVNDIANNPVQKNKESYMKYRIKMLKLEMFFIDRVKFVYTMRLFNLIVRPIGGFIIVSLKYIIQLPIGKIIMKLFPNWSAKTIELQKYKED